MKTYRKFFKQTIPRLTWEQIQTTLGYVTSGALVTTNSAKSVSYWGGATVVETYKSEWGGFTLGSYIIGERGIHANPHNTLFQHEYGHSLQSRSWGPAYISRAALPSLFDTWGHSGDHSFHQIEQDANARAFKYFHEHSDNFYQSQADWDEYSGRGWNFSANPLDINGNGSMNYVDYSNPEQMERVNALKVKPSSLDYISGGLIYQNPLPIALYGLRNHVHYNKYKYTIR